MAIIVGSVAVEVVPSAAGFRQKLAAQLRDMKVTIDVDADTAGAIAKIKGVEEIIDRIGNDTKLDIDADTKKAVRKIASLETKLAVLTREIDLGMDIRKARRRIAELVIEIEALERLKIDVPVHMHLRKAALLAEITALEEALRAAPIDIPVDVDRNGGAARQASFLTGRLRAMIVAALALGPALIPLAGSLTAVFGAMLVPLAAATAGIGAFAVFAVPAITKVVKASSDLAKAQKAVDDALTPASRKTALARQAQLLERLDPATRAAVVSLNNLKTSYKNFSRALQPAVFRVFNAGLAVANAGLPLLARLAKVTAPILEALGNKLATALKSPEVHRFVEFLAAQAGPAIQSFARIFALFGKGFVELLYALAPLAPRIMAGFENMMRGFSNLGRSAGFRKFLDYAIESLPIVGNFIGTLAGAVGSLLIAFAPFGDTVLKILTVLLEGFRRLADFAPELVVALALVAGAFILFGGAELAVVIAAIVAVGAAFKFLYDNSAPVRAVVAEIMEIFSRLADRALPKLREAFAVIMVGIGIAIDVIGEAIARNRPEIDEFLGALEELANWWIDNMIPIMGFVVAGLIVLGQSISLTIEAISLFVDAINFVTAVFQAWPGAISTATSPITSALDALIGAIRTIWSNFWDSEFGGSVSNGLGIVTTAVTDFWTTLRGLFDDRTLTFSEAWDAYWGSEFSDSVSGGLDNVTTAVDDFWSTILGKFNDGVDAVRIVWNMFWASEFGTLVKAALDFVAANVRLGLALVTVTFQIAMITIQGTVQLALLVIQATFQNVMLGVQRTVAIAWEVIKGYFRLAVAAVLASLAPLIAIVQLIVGPFNQANAGVSSSIGQLISLVSGIPGRIAGAIGDLSGLLFHAGQSLISGLISGITSALGGLTSILQHVTSLIPKVKGPATKDLVLLTPAGHLIMQGLIAGIEAEEPNLIDKLNSLTSKFKGFQPNVGLSVAGAASDGGSTTYAFYPRTMNVDERNIGDVIYARELRERIGRPS